MHVAQDIDVDVAIATFSKSSLVLLLIRRPIGFVVERIVMRPVVIDRTGHTRECELELGSSQWGITPVSEASISGHL